MSDLSIFNNWLLRMLDGEEIDIDTKCTGRDGTELDFGDVITAIVLAPEWEKQKIRKQMLQCKAKHIPLEKLLKEYGKALNLTHKRGIDEKPTP